MNKKPVFLWFLYLLRAITFCTCFAFISMNAYSLTTECPQNATLNNNTCSCNSGFTPIDNSATANTKATAYTLDGSVVYKATLTTPNGDMTVLATGYDSNSGDLLTTYAPGTAGSKCWCRITVPFETKWKYSGSSISGTVGTDTWMQACVSKCGDKLKSNNIASFFNGYMINGGTICEGSSTVSCDTGYEPVNNACTPINYTIAYNLNGGTNNENNLENYTIESSTIIFASPSKTGYNFGGWYTDSGFNNLITQIPTGSTGNKTLYAKWTAIECGNNQYFDTVSNSCMYCPTGFNPTAGATSIDDCVIIAHPGTYLNPNNIDKSITGGYTYIMDGDSYTQQPEFTNAKQNSWKVFFDYGNLSGRAACSDIWAEYGSVNQDVEFNPTTWYGYNCWCDIEQYGDCTVNNRQNCSDTETITTKSKWVSFGYVDDGRCWQDCAGKCANAMEQNEYLRSNALSTIALQVEDCPAGYYCPEEVIIHYGNFPESYGNKEKCPEQYPLSEQNTSSKSYCYKECDTHNGYTVSGIDYYGDSVTDTCSYTPNTYTVTYEINYDGETNPASTSYTVGENAITLPTVTRTGYTLDGWYTSSNEKINSPYTPTGNITLYAHWTEIICDNTQYFDEGTNSCIECPAEYPNSVNNKCSISKSCPALSCPDYSTCHYVGDTTWIEYINEPTTTHCQIEIEDCDDGYTSNGETCVPNTYTVTYDINYSGGTNPVSTSYTVGGSAITLPTVTRTGYTLDGWYTSSNEKINSPYTPTGNITLYAHWTEIICDNTQYFDEGTNSCIECPAEYPNSVNNKCSIEKSCPALVCPEHSTCSYIGTTTWIEYINEPTTEHCQIQIDGCDDGYTPNNNECVPNTYTVTYYANGGSVNPGSVQYTVGDDALTLPTPTYSGYNFGGWSDAQSGGNLIGLAGVAYTPTGNITLYAQWISSSYPIHYELNGGTNYENAPGAYNSGIGATINGTPIKEGFEFVGWCSDAELTDCSKTYIIPASAYGIQIIYVKWNFKCESGKWYHIGENDKDKICLYANKKTSPAIAVASANEAPHYILLSNDPELKINSQSDIKMHVLINGETFNAYDESVNQ